MYIPGYETNNGQTKHREVSNKQCGTNANSTNKYRGTRRFTIGVTLDIL